MKKKETNKKIIIGAVVVVVLILLTSFTSVAGERKTLSSLKNSPLFHIRTEKAIEKENTQQIERQFLQKGTKIPITFLPKTSEEQLIEEIVKTISIMDDETFNKFVNLVIQKLTEYNKIQEEQIPQVKESLQFIRDDPNTAKQQLLQNNKVELKTITFACPTYDDSLECLIQDIILAILYILTMIASLIRNLLIYHRLTFAPRCDT